MKTFDVYLFGMIVRTNSFLLRDDFPTADAYACTKFPLPLNPPGLEEVCSLMQPEACKR